MKGRFGARGRHQGRFFLYLQHMISKAKSVKEAGSQIGIVFHGLQLFTYADSCIAIVPAKSGE
jgi:hypothetical protein